MTRSDFGSSLFAKGFPERVVHIGAGRFLQLERIYSLVSDMALHGGAGDGVGGAGDQQFGIPPHTGEEDPKQGVLCFKCGHTSVGSWESLWTHFRRYHNTSVADIEGSPFQKLLRAEVNTRAKNKREAVKTAKAAAEEAATASTASVETAAAAAAAPAATASGSAADATGNCSPTKAGGSSGCASAAAETVAATDGGFNGKLQRHQCPFAFSEHFPAEYMIRTRDDGSIFNEANGDVWAACWVRLNRDGDIRLPTEIEELSQTAPCISLKEASRRAAASRGGDDVRLDSSQQRPVALVRPAVSTDVSSHAQHAPTAALVTPIAIEVAAPRAPPTIEVAAHSSELSVLNDVVDRLATAIAGRSGAPMAAPAEPTPAMELNFTAAAMEWRPTDGQSGITKWPLELYANIDFGPFKAYIKRAKDLEDSSINQYAQKLALLFSLFDSLPQDFSHEAMMTAFYATGVAERWQDLPIMSTRFSTTRNMLSSLGHFTNHLIVSAGRKSDEVSREALRCIKQLQLEVFQPMNTQAQSAKDESGNKKLELDGTRKANLPSPELVLQSMREALVDLATILGEGGGDDGVFCDQLKRAANVIMVGLIWGNSYAGRPGEWVSLSRQNAKDFIHDGGNTIVMKHHKTERHSASWAGTCRPATRWRSKRCS